MQLSNNGLKMIKQFEGCSLTVYKDVAGFPTIGVGHLIKPGEKFTTITQAQADDLLRSDARRFEIGVSNLVTVPLTQNQFDALVSFSFNLGLNALTTSTLLKKLNSGDYKGAADEFLKWNRAGGKVVQGITNRRTEERRIFLGGN